jgi:hypothetical protein
MSSFFSLNRTDVWKGLVVAVLGAVLAALQQALTGHGLEFAAYDWASILNIAVSAGFAYLAKNLLSTQDGKFAGLI